MAFDAPGRMLAVKARAVGEPATSELPRFRSGDRIVLTWSGFDAHTDGISRAVRYDAAKKWNEPFTFPVEFVTYETSNQYVTFKLQVPAGNVDALKSLKPGEWVTGTSKHRPSNESEAIMAVKSYVTSAASPN